jgi:serine/threonine protein kinase
MALVKCPNLEPVPGYRLVEPLGKGGFGEVWKCLAPGDLFKAIKFVNGEAASGLHDLTTNGADQELRSFNLIKSIRHPFVLSIERVEVVDQELIIIMELADRSLHDVQVSYQKAGLPGVPRRELVKYLRQAAEALDVLNLEYGLQHLDIKPRNLFVVHQYTKIADFGLVNSLADLSKGTLNLAAVTPLYASPESFVGKITLFSDQYSLAIAYHELLTGTFPFDGRNFRQLAMQHTSQEPDLSRLSDADRPVVARAMAKNPRERYGSCAEFVDELLTIPSPEPVKRPTRRVPVVQPAAPSELVSQDVNPVAQTMAVPPVKQAAAIAMVEPAETVTEPIPGNERVPAPAPLASVEVARPDAKTEPRQDCGVLPGYHFRECISRATTGEVWLARRECGGNFLVKLVAGFDAEACGGAGGRLERLKNLSHEYLIKSDLIVTPSGQLAIVTEHVGQTLADRLREYQQKGQPGIPRDELCAYMAAVAQCLDDLAESEQLHHLSLTPREIVLTDDSLRVHDFGLAELVWLPGEIPTGSINPRYSAPELAAGRASATSDQYTLALIYQEMLTGLHPFRNVGSRSHSYTPTRPSGKPDLSLVPAHDRPALLRAMSTDPERRFGSCSELMQILLVAGAEPEFAGRSGPAVQRAVLASRSDTFYAAGDPTTPPAGPVLADMLNAVVAQARGEVEVHMLGGARYLVRPGRRIEHECCARLLPTAIKVQLHGFRQEWGAQVVSSDVFNHVFQIRAGGSLWKRMLGRGAVLEVRVRFRPPDTTLVAMTPVTIVIEPTGSTSEEAASLLNEMGAKVLESLRRHLQAEAERRQQDRLPFEQPVTVRPVYRDGSIGGDMIAQGVNISLGGMRIVIPFDPETDQLVVELIPPASPRDHVAINTRIIRIEPCSDGLFDVALCFIMN